MVNDHVGMGSGRNTVTEPNTATDHVRATPASNMVTKPNRVTDHVRGGPDPNMVTERNRVTDVLTDAGVALRAAHIAKGKVDGRGGER